MTAIEQTLRTIEPNVRLRPRQRREWSQVDAGLRDKITALVKGSKPWPLLLHGTAGTGKTSAALCLCDVAATACYLDVDLLCDKIMGGEDDLWEWIEGKSLAVLDELGAREKVGDLHYQAVKRFADARDGLPTIYVSNLAPAELRAVYDDRIYSRLTCGTWHELNGTDRRRDQ